MLSLCILFEAIIYDDLVVVVVVVVEPLFSYSPKIRRRKSDIIRGRPSRSVTAGSHPRISLAFVMSGFLLCGSSAVFNLKMIFAFGSMVSFTTYFKITHHNGERFMAAYTH